MTFRPGCWTVTTATTHQTFSNVAPFNQRPPVTLEHVYPTVVSRIAYLCVFCETIHAHCIVAHNFVSKKTVRPFLEAYHSLILWNQSFLTSPSKYSVYECVHNQMNPFITMLDSFSAKCELSLLPPAYVVRREGNVLTRVCPSIHQSVCPRGRGGTHIP